MTQIYHLPVLSRPDLFVFRAPGPGLGNLLFPIARAVQAQQESGGVLVFPTLRQLKIGTFLRRERDKRTYGDIFRRRSLADTGDWITAALLAKRLETEDAASARVTRYVGMARQFYDLARDPGDFLQFLTSAMRHPVPEIDVSVDVAIHVRLGDFAAPERSATSQNTRIPLDWYLDALELARDRLGTRNVRGVLFSDASPEAVIGELGIDGFVPEPAGNALSSILLMSRAQVLIGSRSTFSLWGQYLGQSEAIWPQGFDLAKYKHPDPEKDHFV